MDRLSAFAKIKHRSLFSLMSEIDAFALAGAATFLEVPAGKPVPRPETPSELLIVVTGEVVLLDGPGGEPAGRVAPGRSLELWAYLSGAPEWRHAWFCEQPTTLLSLPRRELDEVVAGTPGLAIYLERMCTDAGVRKLKTDLRLGGVAQQDVIRIISKLARVDWQTLEAHYRKHPGLVVIERGRLEVTILAKGKKEPIGPFRRGDCLFLDDSLAGVKATEATQLWYLAKSTWAAELSKHDLEAFRAIADPVTVKRLALEALPSEPPPPPPPPPNLEEDLGVTIADFKVTAAELAKLHRRRRPIVRQHDEMDCAAACMSMIARYHGRRIDVASFRSLIHVTREGASMLAIKRAADVVGLKAMGVMSGMKGLRDIRVPLIALMGYHYVVVYRIADGEVVVGDPARGLVTYTKEAFEKEWSKTALLFAPTEAFATYPESKTAFWKYLELFKGTKRLLVEVLVASVLMFIFGLALPVILQYFVDSVLPGGDTATLTLLALGLLTIRLANAAVSWVHRHLLVHVTSRVDALSSALFVRHLLSMPLSFFAIRTVGDITKRMSELRRIRSIVLDQSLQLLTLALGGLINTFVIGLYSVKILAVLGGALLLPAILVKVLAPRLAAKLRDVHKAASDWQTRSWEQFDGLASIKAIGGEVAARWKWGLDLGRSLKLRKEMGWLESLSRTATGFLEQLISILVLLYAVYLFSDGQITAGHVLAVSMLSGMVVSAAMALLNSWHDINELGVSLGRVDDVITGAIEPPGPPEEPGVEHRITGRVSVENVTFQYGSELSPVVLSDVSLAVEPGETVALVGRSGSGKSTLGYMFNLLYAPTHGKILFDGVEHSKIPLTQIRRRAAMIVQDNSIFSGTILENISLGDPHPSFERVVEAAQAADAHEFISGFPKGYSTQLGESGEGLSGGQKQRINIARALYRDPQILIMDEATSSLDAISEAKIVKNLKSRSGTTIVIAHRLNTVMHADRIVVLDSGRIVEQGSHSELLAKRGHYSRLFAKQLAL